MKSRAFGRREFTLGLLPSLVLGQSAVSAFAADAPGQPIKMIVPFPPGGGTDGVARVISTSFATLTKTPLIIDNRPGASGTIGIGAASKMPADGINLVLGQADNMAVAPYLLKSVPYNPLEDLQPIAFVADIPIVIVTSVDTPYKTLADVVRAGKSDKEDITFGSAGVGTTPHLSGELLAKAAGIKMRHISYKGSAPALTDALAGRISLMMSSISLIVPHLKSGKLRALAVTSATRSKALPDVPTVAEATGLANFNVGTWYGIFSPKGLAAAKAAKLNADINTVLGSKEVSAFIEGQEGGNIVKAGPELLAKKLADDTQLWKRVIKEANVSLE
ncbi:Bug family tripartite tricarboxylate transporter substrate binding protein [Ottowia thiooxydans]|uniref:Tripartite-type tricarboxylate transporter receptor subunit TctC n=1 Tax=Ottowia thiooxydans TaxID=219182 RepID=A0ABV2Q8J2_9BURK